LPPLSVESRDLDSLDSILYQLRKHYYNDSSQDPAERLVRDELYETIHALLCCLTNRERSIFKTYFFDQLTPREIAELFQTTTGNVYMILSRSKKKITEERIRSTLNLYISKRRMVEKMKQVIMKKPRVLHWKSANDWSYEPWTTAGFNMYGILENTAKSSLSIAEVLGLTGQAFRLNIVKESIHTAGATLYNWNRILSKGMKNLGFQVKTVGKPSGKIGSSGESQTMEVLTEALELIQLSLDKGHYVLSFDLTLPEFGVIYGFNDNNRQLYVGDVNVSFHRKPDEHELLAYDRLGRNDSNNLFVLAVTEAIPLTSEEALLGALELILEHAYGKEPALEMCANGLQAYDAWIEAYEKGHIDNDGNSYTTELVHDARKYAALFLQETAAQWDGAQKDQVEDHLMEASFHYQKCAEFFHTMCGMFPFAGERLSLNDPVNGQKAIALLRQAKLAEEKGLASLEKISQLLINQN
jgi:predicted DNA-binding protein YlxM (UPF0122 family)